MKRKLFLLLCALLTMIGVQNVKADVIATDITNNYITNPSFETGDMTGWSVLNEGNIVSPDGDTGVKAVSSYPLSNSDGSYIFNYYQKAWTWNSATDGIQQTITGLPAGLYRLTAVLGGWNGWEMTLHANSSTQSITMDADNSGKEFSVDVIIGSGEDLVVKASMVHTGSNVYDNSFLKADNFKLYSLKNVDFSDRMSNSTSEWTGVGKQTKIAVCKTDGVETYQGNESIFSAGDILYQTITGLPNGYYEVSFYAWENFCKWGNLDSPAVGDGYAQAFANGSVYNLTSIKNTDGRGWNNDNLYTLRVYVTDGTLKYGVKNVRDGGNWVACQKKSLTYLGAEIDDYTNLISNADFEESHAAMSNSSRGDKNREIFIPQGWTVTYTANGWTLSALKSDDLGWNNFSTKNQPADGGDKVYWTRLRDNNTSLTLSQKVALPSGYYTLNAEGYNESSANGTARLSVKVGTTTYSNNFIDGSWNHRQVPFYLSGAQEIEIIYSVSSTNGVVIAGVDNLTLTRLSDNVFTTGDDVTNLILSPNCNTNTEWAGGASGGRTMDNMMAYDGSTRDVFSSSVYYDISSKNGQRHQSISLPLSGTYKLTTYCKVPGTNNNGFTQIWVDNLGNYIDHTNARHLYTVDTNGNKTTTINTDGSGWYANEIYFTADAGESKTIYINLSRGNGSGNTEYAYVSGMKLTYLGATPEVSFDEAVVNPVVETNLENANVTIARSLKSDRWNTFSVPFNMEKPDGWTVKELTAVKYNETTSNYSLTFSDADAIEAGKAYMVKPGSNVPEVIATNVTINTNTVTSSEVKDGDYSANFVGNNNYLTSVPMSSYIISNNVFYVVDSEIIQKGFRGYITVGGSASARPTVSFGIEDGFTSIQNVLVNGLDESNAQKDGKYLINGKIVIVKNGMKYDANGKKLN